MSTADEIPSAMQQQPVANMGENLVDSQSNSTTGSISAVGKFLLHHNLGEYVDAMRGEGFDDVEDLEELVAPESKDLFERVVPKPGHRAKLCRILRNAQQLRGGFLLPRNGPDGDDGDGYDDSMSVADSMVSSATALHYREMLRAAAAATQRQKEASAPNLVDRSAPPSMPRVSSYPSTDVATVPLPATSNISPSPQRVGTHSAVCVDLAPKRMQSLLPPGHPGLYEGHRGQPQRSPRSSSPMPQPAALYSHHSNHRMLQAPDDDGYSISSFATVRPSQSVATCDFMDDTAGASTSTSASAAAFTSHHGTSFASSGEPSVGKGVAQSQSLSTKLKVIVVGAPACGKSTFIHRIVRNEFVEHIRSTLGVEFSEKRFQITTAANVHRVVALHFWDIWGQEAVINATRAYYTAAKGAFIVYDASKRDTLDKAVLWKRDLDSKVRSQANGLPIPVILIGNKHDLAVKTPSQLRNTSMSFPSLPRRSSSSNVLSDDKLLEPTPDTVFQSKEEIEAFCNEHRFTGHFFTSAKTGSNVRDAVDFLIMAMLKMEPLEIPGTNPRAMPAPNPSRIVTLDSVQDGRAPSRSVRSSQSVSRDTATSKKRTCVIL